MYKYIIFLFIISCGEDMSIKEHNILRKSNIYKAFPHKTGVAEEFVPYVKRFEEAGNVIVRDIPIQFGKTHEGFAAECVISTTGERFITIDELFWINASENLREVVIFHEEGHCTLNKFKHNDELRIVDEGWGVFVIPVSLMHCCFGEPPHYQYFRDYYIKELFQ